MDEKKFAFKYLVTDGETTNFHCSKEAAEKDALEEASFNGGEWDIYEIKHVGLAYIPDPGVVIDWD